MIINVMVKKSRTFFHRQSDFPNQPMYFCVYCFPNELASEGKQKYKQKFIRQVRGIKRPVEKSAFIGRGNIVFFLKKNI